MQIDMDMISNGEEVQNKVDIFSDEDVICAGYLSDMPDDVSNTEDEWNDEDNAPDASDASSANLKFLFANYDNRLKKSGRHF
ncbi:hypothetical protein BDQ17DRAFT_1436655 [Cyathus striatus]|nr:hypothetical protein BDQ17DRAFT_1436655 [Cyathus striatus]